MKCLPQWVSLVPAWHHTQLLQYHWLYPLSCSGLFTVSAALPLRSLPGAAGRELASPTLRFAEKYLPHLGLSFLLQPQHTSTALLSLLCPFASYPQSFSFLGMVYHFCSNSALFCSQLGCWGLGVDGEKRGTTKKEDFTVVWPQSKLWGVEGGKNLSHFPS